MTDVVLFGLNETKTENGIISQNELCEWPGIHYIAEHIQRTQGIKST